MGSQFFYAIGICNISAAFFEQAAKPFYFYIGEEYKSMVNPIKPPLTYSGQVKKLQLYGLEIEDTDFAVKIVSHMNYYRLTGYLYQYKNPNNDLYNFPNGFTFDDTYLLYEFDVMLSTQLSVIIQKIEVYFKTKVAYYHAHKYGALGYCDAANFSSKSEHDNFMKLFKDNVSKNKHKKFVSHHINKYAGSFPLWVAVELFTFGMTWKFYDNLLIGDKKQISREFTYSRTDKAYGRLPPKHLLSWLGCICHTRNLIAHYMRLYNFKFTDAPLMSLSGTPKIQASYRIFDILYISKYLYPDADYWNETVLSALNKLISDFQKQTDFLDLNCIGFPENWLETLRV